MKTSRRFAATACVAVAVVAGCASMSRDEGSPLPLLSAVREFVVPWDNAYPQDVALDSLGRVWFTDRITHAIGMFDPATEQFTRHETPTRRSAPYGMVTAPDGGIWFAESVAQRIARIDPATGSIVEYPIEGSTKGPNLIAVGSGTIWFSLRDESAYGSFDIATGSSSVTKLTRLRPYGVTIAPDGTVWFGMAELLALDPRTRQDRRHDVSAGTPIPPNLAPSLPDSVRRDLFARSFVRDMRRIATDRAGNVWYADHGRGHVVRYSPTTGAAQTYPTLQNDARPYGLTITRAGHVWYGEAGTGDIVVLDPVSGERRRAAVPTPGAVVRHLVVDERRGRVWLPMSDAGRLGVIDLSRGQRD
jgi:virginiamycin B lyase